MSITPYASAYGHQSGVNSGAPTGKRPWKKPNQPLASQGGKFNMPIYQTAQQQPTSSNQGYDYRLNMPIQQTYDPNGPEATRQRYLDTPQTYDGPQQPGAPEGYWADNNGDMWRSGPQSAADPGNRRPGVRGAGTQWWERNNSGQSSYNPWEGDGPTQNVNPNQAVMDSLRSYQPSIDWNAINYFYQQQQPQQPMPQQPMMADPASNYEQYLRQQTASPTAPYAGLTQFGLQQPYVQGAIRGGAPAYPVWT